VLAGLWCSFRESLVAGFARRDMKEAVAVGISRLNDCPYCIDAHAVLLRATRAHQAAELIQAGRDVEISDPGLRSAALWAKATRSPGDPILATPPFSRREAPEFIGTAIWIHYINRMSRIFLGTNLIPLRSNALGLRALAERAGGLYFAPIIRRQRRQGDSIHILPAAEVPRDLAWAADSPVVSRAFAAFSGAVEEAGSQALDVAVRGCVQKKVEEWNGTDPGMGRRWTEPIEADLNEDQRPAARLALLTAFTPYLVERDVVEDFQSRRKGDETLLGAVAWSSFAVARKIGTWLMSPAN
jgi:AhpD family alkylhydroperoxidase